MVKEEIKSEVLPDREKKKHTPRLKSPPSSKAKSFQRGERERKQKAFKSDPSEAVRLCFVDKIKN